VLCWTLGAFRPARLRSGWRGRSYAISRSRSIATSAAAFPLLGLPRRPLTGDGRRRGRLCFKDFGPVEFDVGVVFFDPADRGFVEGWPPDFDAWRRAEPVKKARLRSAAAPAGMDERGCFIPAFVAGKPQEWQSYLRLGDRPVFLAGFGAGFFLTGLAFGFGLALAGFAAAGRAADARLSDGALYAGRKRISSPIQ
jgi:hypothetical protein